MIFLSSKRQDANNVYSPKKKKYHFVSYILNDIYIVFSSFTCVVQLKLTSLRLVRPVLSNRHCVIALKT